MQVLSRIYKKIVKNVYVHDKEQVETRQRT